MEEAEEAEEAGTRKKGRQKEGERRGRGGSGGCGGGGRAGEEGELRGSGLRKVCHISLIFQRPCMSVRACWSRLGPRDTCWEEEDGSCPTLLSPTVSSPIIALCTRARANIWTGLRRLLGVLGEDRLGWWEMTSARDGSRDREGRGIVQVVSGKFICNWNLSVSAEIVTVSRASVLSRVVFWGGGLT